MYVRFVDRAALPALTRQGDRPKCTALGCAEVRPVGTDEGRPAQDTRRGHPGGASTAYIRRHRYLTFDTKCRMFETNPDKDPGGDI